MKKTKIILPMVVFALSSCGPTGDPSSFSPSTESPSTSESTSVVEPEEPMDDGLYFNEDIVNFKAKTISQELSDGTSNAKATWEAEYLPEGVLIKVKVLDPNIFAGKNFFSSDYAEVQIQAFDSSYIQDFHTYNFICNTNGQVLVREYNKGYKEITPFTSDFSNVFSRTSGGYNHNLFISYNLLKTTYQNAVGNVRIYTSMKKNLLYGKMYRKT